MAPQGPSAGPPAGPPEAKRPRWDAGLEPAELGRAKAELAAAFRVLAGFRLNEGIFNHLSCRVPGRKDLFMTNRFGVLWSEMTPDDLLVVAEDRGEISIVCGEGRLEVRRKRRARGGCRDRRRGQVRARHVSSRHHH